MPRGKCIKCSSKAFVYLRYANARFCKEHFIEFFTRRVKRTIERFGMIREGEKVLVAVSGGKDSVSLLHVLNDLKKEMKFELLGTTIDLGIRNFSENSLEYAIKNFEELNIDYKVISLSKEYNFTLDEAVEKIRYRKPCSICGVIKRYLLNKVAIEEKANKLATGHHLDDMARFILAEFISGNAESLARLYPSIPEKRGMASRIKPLAFTPERDCLTYAKAKELSFTSMLCPYKKRLPNAEIVSFLDAMEKKHAGKKIAFVKGFFKSISPALRSYHKIKEFELKKCKVCGMPSSFDICGFCNIAKKVKG